jgi:hypothetical protein
MLTPPFNKALDIAPAAARYQAEHEATLRKDRQRHEATAELARTQANLRRLEALSRGEDPERDPRIQQLLEVAERSDHDVEAVDASIEAAQAQAAVMTEQGPAAVAAAVATLTALLDTLAEAKGRYDRAVQAVEHMQSILRISVHGGAVTRIVGVSTPRAAAMVTIINKLRDLLGPEFPNGSGLTRLRREWDAAA